MSGWNNRQSGHALLALACVTAMCLSSCGSKDQTPERPRPARTMVVTPANATEVRTYPALIEPASQVDLSFDVSGPLVKLAVQEGDPVDKGDLIGQIRLRDFDIAVRRVQSQLQQAQAELAKMKAGARPEDILRLESALRKAKVQLGTREKDLARMKRSFAQGVATQQELDSSQENRDTAVETVQQATEELNIAKAGSRKEDITAMKAQIEGIKADLARVQADRDDASLTAPFAGVITTKLVDQFAIVQAKQPIVRLVTDEIEARVDVPEQDVLKRQDNLPTVRVLVRDRSGREHAYPAEFKKWSPEANPETGTFAVFLSVRIPEEDRKQLRVLSGMSATVEATMTPQPTTATTQPGVLACRVPLAAVFSLTKGESSVWVVNPKSLTLSRRKVRVGEQIDGEIWVLDGIKTGEEILTAGVHYVREGQIIRRTNAPEGKEAQS